MTRLHAKIARFFPYPQVRLHQDEYIEAVYKAVNNGNSILIEGSNGLGKTVSTLAACLPKAVDDDLKILYVARTHRQHDRVIEELKAISKKHPVSGVSIRGRHEMCLHGLIARHRLDSRTVMEMCEMLKSRDRCPYFLSIDKRDEEYGDLQRNVTANPCTGSEIQRICSRRGFCAYELVKSCLANVDVVALSYLYVFDPVIRNAFLRSFETPLSKVILIIDEAHNLPEAAVDIASSSLSLFTIREAESEAEEFKHGEIIDFIKALREEIEKSSKKNAKQIVLSQEFLTNIAREEAGASDPQAFFEQLHDLGIQIKRGLLLEGKNPRSFIHALGYFALKWRETAEDPSFIRVLTKYTSRQGALTAKLEIAALDPSKMTQTVFSQVHSTIVTSGTLQPIEAYAKIAKMPEDVSMKAVPSPFPKEHVLPLVSCGVTTAMERRTPDMFRKIVNRIVEVVEATPFNTGVFAPSYDVLGSLLSCGLKDTLKKPLFCEYRSMTSRENERLVSEFKKCSFNRGAVLIGVQGGRSSEGVDYPGDEMNSSVIVGVPYAEPTPKVKAQISYFEDCFPKVGREYAYVIPAMKKAAQAAGRPIRTPQDMGAMIFLDCRFATDYLRGFLPSWIRDSLKVLPDEEGAVSCELEQFFRKDC